ncbi:MAG: hypothetical protein ACW992_14010 [Candidatus Thorarchaeota archaeon]|jgi:hypothetical protein
MGRWGKIHRDADFEKTIVREMKRHHFTQHDRAARGLPHVEIPDTGWYVGTDGQVHEVDLRPKKGR